MNNTHQSNSNDLNSTNDIDDLFSFDTSNDDFASMFETDCEAEITNEQLDLLCSKTMKRISNSKRSDQNKLYHFGRTRTAISNTQAVTHNTLERPAFHRFLRAACIFCVIVLLTSTSVYAVSLVAPAFVKTYLPGGSVIVDMIYGSSQDTDQSSETSELPAYQVLEQPYTIELDGHSICIQNIIYDGQKLNITYTAPYCDGKSYSDFTDGACYYTLALRKSNGMLADYTDELFDLIEEKAIRQVVFEVAELNDSMFLLQEVKIVEEPLYTIEGDSYISWGEHVTATLTDTVALNELPLVNAKQIESLSDYKDSVTKQGITLLAENSYDHGIQHIGVSFDSAFLDETLDSFGYLSSESVPVATFTEPNGIQHSFYNKAHPLGDRDYFELETPKPFTGTLTIPYVNIIKKINTSFEFDVPSPGTSIEPDQTLEAGDFTFNVEKITCGTESAEGQYSLKIHITLSPPSETARLQLIDCYADGLLEYAGDHYYCNGGYQYNCTQIDFTVLIPADTKHAKFTLLDTLCRVYGNWELPVTE